MRRFIFTAPFILLLAALSIGALVEGIQVLQEAYAGGSASAHQVLGDEESLTGGDRSTAAFGFLFLAAGVLLAAGFVALCWWSFRDAPEETVDEPELTH